MPHRYLVTGGAGFLGSTLVDRLLADGHQVAVMDNFDPSYERTRKQSNLWQAAHSDRFRLIEADVTSAALASVWNEFQPERVVHLAGKSGVCASIEDPAGHARANVDGTLNVLEQARLFPTVRLVFASSADVYGDQGERAVEETANTDAPLSPYAATKKAGEMLCRLYNRRHGISVTCLRLFTVYGPRNRPDMAIARFTRLIDRGEAVPIRGNGTSRRDYVFVDDAVEGLVQAAESGEGFGIYNLGSGRSVELAHLVKLLGAALVKAPRIDWRPLQPGEVRHTWADISLARWELGYAPTVSLEEGIQRYVDWYRSEGAWQSRFRPSAQAA